MAAETLATLYTTPPDIIYRSDRDAEGRLDSSTPIQFVLTNINPELRKSITAHAKKLRAEGQDDDQSISDACKQHVWVEIVYFDGETPQRFVQSAVPSTSPWPLPDVDMALDAVGIRAYLRRTSLMISSAHAKRPFRVAFVVVYGDRCTTVSAGYTLLSKPFRVLEKRAKKASSESKGQTLEPPVEVPGERVAMLRRIRMAYALLRSVALESHNASMTANAVTPTSAQDAKRGKKRRLGGGDLSDDPAVAGAQRRLLAAGATLHENLALNMTTGDVPEADPSMFGGMMGGMF
ncbi:unnamed protein product, partial [Symbiodinium sp. KB8]